MRWIEYHISVGFAYFVFLFVFCCFIFIIIFCCCFCVCFLFLFWCGFVVVLLFVFFTYRLSFQTKANKQFIRSLYLVKKTARHLSTVLLLRIPHYSVHSRLGGKKLDITPGFLYFVTKSETLSNLEL